MEQNLHFQAASFEEKKDVSFFPSNAEAFIENIETTEYLVVADAEVKAIPCKVGCGIWGLFKYFTKGMSYLEELIEDHDNTVFKLHLGSDKFVVINDFKAIEATYDLTKVEKLPYFGPLSLNWNMVKNFRPSFCSNGYDHELKKSALLQYNSYCMKNLSIVKLIELVQHGFKSLENVENDREGFLLEEYLERLVTEIYTDIMVGGNIDYDILQKWKKKSLLLTFMPKMGSEKDEKEVTDELFKIYEATPYIQKLREFIASPLEDECLLSQLVWAITFNGWVPICTFIISELCCYLRLSEADQILLRKEAEEFLQSKEKSFETLDSLYYTNKLYLEATRLFHPPALNYCVAIKDFILNSESGFFQIRRDDLLIGNRHAAQRDATLFENPADFSLHRDIELYEKYVKSFGGSYSQPSDIRNHKCTSQEISSYISKIFLVYFTKCDIKLKNPLVYTGKKLLVKAADEPVVVNKFRYKP